MAGFWTEFLKDLSFVCGLEMSWSADAGIVHGEKVWPMMRFYDFLRPFVAQINSVVPFATFERIEFLGECGNNIVRRTIRNLILERCRVRQERASCCSGDTQRSIDVTHHFFDREGLQAVVYRRSQYDSTIVAEEDNINALTLQPGNLECGGKSTECRDDFRFVDWSELAPELERDLVSWSNGGRTIPYAVFRGAIIYSSSVEEWNDARLRFKGVPRSREGGVLVKLKRTVDETMAKRFEEELTKAESWCFMSERWPTASGDEKDIFLALLFSHMDCVSLHHLGVPLVGPST